MRSFEVSRRSSQRGKCSECPLLAVATPRPASVLPKILEPLGRELGVAHRVHDVLVSKIVLQRARVLSVVRKLVPGRVPQHVGMNWKWERGRLTESREQLPEPAALIGAARSLMNTNRPALSSRLRARNMRSSSHPESWPTPHPKCVTRSSGCPVPPPTRWSVNCGRGRIGTVVSDRRRKRRTLPWAERARRRSFERSRTPKKRRPMTFA